MFMDEKIGTQTLLSLYNSVFFKEKVGLVKFVFNLKKKKNMLDFGAREISW